MFEQIGRYKVQEKLGEGAMAEVYKAYDPSIDRALAIKLLKAERCSDSEYRSRFLREAMAAGVPVIGSRVGGIQETVVDGETGLLVPPRDSMALAAAIELLLARPALARAYGAAGRRRVAEFFSPVPQADKVQTMYDGLLRGDP